MENENYCKIYFNASETNEYVLASFLNLDACEIDMLNNMDYDENKLSTFPDGFLFFRYVLDIEFKYIPLSEKVVYTNTILNNFWSMGIPAVAVCSFEDELLPNGGYKSSEIPFPVK